MDSSDVIAICGVVIAFAAVAVAVWEGYIARQHNIRSVKPYIDANFALVKTENISCSIVNKGGGTAFIESLSFKTNKNSRLITNYGSYHEFFINNGIDCSKTPYYFGTLDSSAAFATDEEFQLFFFPTSGENSALHKQLLDLICNLEIVIEYRCIYEKPYRSSIKSNAVTK